MQGDRSLRTSGPPSSPFSLGGTPVVLSEGGKVVTDQTEVCTIFNNFFVNVTKDIGNGGTQYDKEFSDHPSIKKYQRKSPRKSTSIFL